MNIIVAVSRNGVIGEANTIPWYYPEDFRWFRDQTMGGVLIMGRKTYESLPKKPLPGRDTVVLTSQADFDAPHVETSWEGVLRFLGSHPGRDVWVAGGGAIYEQVLQRELVETIVLTEIPEHIEETATSVKFPSFEGFELARSFPNQENPELVHRIYVRR